MSTSLSLAYYYRRLAAVTGNPSGISDAIIEHDLPTDSMGFTPAASMQTSIKVAKVYVRIITGVFGYKVQSPQRLDGKPMAIWI